MANITAIDVARTANIGTIVRSESVGTGDGTTTQFSLANDRIIPDSGTAYVDGTETAVTWDYDNGKITFSSAPALGEEITADYSYIENEDLDIAEADWNFVISNAEAEAEKVFQKYYVSETSTDEYFDGNTSDYRRRPLIDKGVIGGYEDFHTANLTLNLSYTPVTKINHIWLIFRGAHIKAFYYDGSYTDDSDEANSVGGTDFKVLEQSSDYFYIGSDCRFEGVVFDLGTTGSGGNISAEYYSSSWNSLTITDETSNLSQNGEIYFTAPSDWDETIVNGEKKYWIRIKTSSNFTTAPTAYHIYLNQDKLLSYELDRANITFNSDGSLHIQGYRIPDGFRNIRVNYSYGLRAGETAPTLYKEFEAIVAAIRMFVAIMGGSYTSVTSFSVPEMSGTIGEPYVQNKATIDILQKRALEIKSLVGGRYVASA